MNCLQCESQLIEPRESEKYCEQCGYPCENRCEFTLIEIKAYLRSMFQGQNCAEDVRTENHRLACAYNLLTDEKYGIACFCDDGKADKLTLNSFAHVKM